MSLDNETAVEETELEANLEQASEELASEQSKSEEGQGVATETTDTEQTGETEDDFDLGEVLTGKAEPEQNESKVPRSARRAIRKSKRQDKEIESLKQQVEQLTNQRPPTVQAQVPERDWDNETDDQFNFRSMQAVLGHQQQVNLASQQQADRVTQANEDLNQQRKVMDDYSNEVDKLNFKGYEDAESRVLDAFPEGSLAYMSKMNPSMTAKIIWHLSHNPDKLDMFANLAHTNAKLFDYEFGKMDASITELESRARRKHKEVSKATGDRALDSSGAVGSSIGAKMQAAANKGDRQLYKKLKAQLNKH